MTAAAYLGWLAATGEQKKVVSVISPVCVLDPSKAMDTTHGPVHDRREERQGHQGRRSSTRASSTAPNMARVFAWLRPNDLIWNYWVNNYLLGNDPPAFDILYWNADTTRLPAAFHADLLGIIEDSPYVHAGKLKVLGQPIDMRKVDVDAYIVAGITDHITPWKACYDDGAHLRREEQFVAGQRRAPAKPAEPARHRQVLLHRRQGRRPATPTTGPAARRATTAAGGRTGWPGCTSARASWSRRPRKLGSRTHQPGVAAPGEYVHQK